MRTEPAAPSFAIAVLLAAIAAAPIAAPAATYTVVDIGVPDDSAEPPVMAATGLNSLGEVTGYYSNA